MLPVPAGDKILIKPFEAPNKSKGGIIIPDKAKEKPTKGVIVAVGPGKVSDYGMLIPMAFKVGQTIVYGKYAGMDLDLGGEAYTIIEQREVYAAYPEGE